MSRPVFSFRPNLKNPEHERAWELLMRVPPGQRNQYLVEGILQKEDREIFKKIIRETVREVLKGGGVEQVSVQEPEEIPNQMLDFLMQMENEGRG